MSPATAWISGENIAELEKSYREVSSLLYRLVEPKFPDQSVRN